MIQNNFGYTSKLVLLLAGLLCLTIDRLKAQESVEEDMENMAGREEVDNLETDEPATAFNIQVGKIDLNKAEAADLLKIGILNAEQVEAFIRYRTLFGKLISFYEVQAIPGWDPGMIENLRPFVMVSEGSRWDSREVRIRPRIENLVVIRGGRQVEESRGYIEKDSIDQTHYLGDPFRAYLRYSCAIKNTLHAGFTAEKDAGESFRKGFDFYSFHLWLTTKGWLKYLALGDYSVNLGQGLIHWQGLAFPKSVDLGLLARQSQAVRPYQSSGESRFHRGIAIGWKAGRWNGNAFLARDLKDANLEADGNGIMHVTSINESGYHRAAAEIEGKRVFRQSVAGGNIGYEAGSFQLNANAIGFWFNYPIQREALPYNLYAIAGRSWVNVSVDYNYILRNLRFFGELAGDARGSFAALSGLVMSADPRLDIGILYRNIGAKFRSFEGGAFTESSEPANESGFWIGLNLKPSRYLAFSTYADLFSFPWLKYRVDAPSNGADYLLRLDWRPDKSFQFESRFRFNGKSMNDSLHALVRMQKLSWRNQLKFAISAIWELRSRLELNAWRAETGPASNGFLTNMDIFYHPPKSCISLNSRLEWFETDDYNSRAYTYENDLPYYYYIPVLYGSGFRYYLNIMISYHSKITTGLKWAQTVYSGVTETGSGWDEVKGKKRSDLRAELLIKF